jgi:adenylyltransferase/sulfurtransferase
MLLVGAGGLGSPAALHLAAVGVECLGIVNADAVELSNLQRQLLHDTASVGMPKVAWAEARLRATDPTVDVIAHEARLTSANAMALFDGYDVIGDGSDNFPTRYLINDACILLGKPNVFGSLLRFEGQASVFSSADVARERLRH